MENTEPGNFSSADPTWYNVINRLRVLTVTLEIQHSGLVSGRFIIGGLLPWTPQAIVGFLVFTISLSVKA